MFPSQKYRAGQSSLEYLALAVFVMMGIIIGGPYVVRSINAHFKTLEEGAIDSDREAIVEGPTGVNLTGCNCSDLLFRHCGDGTTLINGAICKETQAVYARNCDPLGCEVDLLKYKFMGSMQECRNDSTGRCCEAEESGKCGNDPDASGVCKTLDGGQREKTKECNSPTKTTKVRCELDGTCKYECQPLGPHASWCNAAVLNVNLTSPDVPVTYRNPKGCTTPGAFCEAQCDTGYTAIVGGCENNCRTIDEDVWYNTSGAAGTAFSYEKSYAYPVTFSIDVWSEDLSLLWRVDGGTLHCKYTSETGIWDMSAVDGLDEAMIDRNCWGWDGDDATQHFIFSVTGKNLWLQVREGGDKGADAMGYHVKVTTGCP